MDENVYREGHVKRNPDTGEVAVRNAFDDDWSTMSGKTWIICGTFYGVRSGSSEEVSSWDDLYVPPVPFSPEPEPEIIYDPRVDQPIPEEDGEAAT